MEATISDQLAWRAVPHEVARLYPVMKSAADIIQEVTYGMPKTAAIFVTASDVIIQADSIQLWEVAGERIKSATNMPVTVTSSLPSNHDETCALVKSGGIWDTPLRTYTSPLVSAAAIPQKMMGGPNPLTSMLMGGLIGGGLGYGSGWLAEKVYGDKHLEKGKARRNFGLLGALAGAGVPGALYGIPAMQRAGIGGLIDKWPFGESNYKEANELLQGESSEVYKEASRSWAGAFTPIPVNDFNQAVWNDVPSAFNPGGHTPPHIAAMTTGLVSGAAAQRSNASFVTPMDVGRIALGMGAGIGSAKLITGLIGPLAGMTPYSREKLQQVGMWAGAMKAITSALF